ncbi:MAG: PD-(D/E)XK nuclease family protein, partial [Bdellovibrionales bacterium]|nr:PD-(D/E)XK nuclease family protein [Bdellovibrionales bacterium]
SRPRRSKTEAEKAGCLFPLSVNFRSQGHVVGWANHVSARIFPKNGEPKEDFEADFQHSGAHHAAGAPVKLVGYSNEEKLDARSEIEPDLLVSVIRDRRASGVALHEIAVIFRRLRGNEAYFSALNRAGIPFVLGASMGFWTSPLVVDSVALLRALYNDRNDLALLSVLRSPWMRWSAERIRPVLECGGEPPGVLDRLRAERKNSTPSRILRLAFREHPGRSSTRERLLMEMLVDVTEELESSGLAFGAVVETLSRSVAWDASESDAEKGGEMPEPSEDGAVKILTVHASKGLEFPVVILPDLDGKPRTDQSAVRFHPGQGIAVKTDTHRREDRDDPPYKEIQQRAAARDAAERARLFYVAVTRAKSELWLLVGHKEAKGEAKPAPRWQGTWGDWVRSVGAGTHAEWVDPPGAVAASLSAERPREEPPPLPPLAPSVPRSVSITELAAFRFCGEFHRRKFVMAWDDRVVDAWPKPENHRLRQAPRNGDADLVLLRKLGLERKDRGIALHRVLERVRDGFHAEEAATWLRDAYENQGACDLGARLQELIRIDLGVLRKFLESETGRKLFSGARAWPEVPFVWKAGGVEVHGAIDRLVELEPGHWVVADYKSSVNDGNLDRYAFQVNTYREAIRAWLGSSAKVDGWLVDLFTAEVHRVGESDEFTETVKGAIANYTLPREEHDPVRRGVAGGEKCFACPYALHCAPGRESVLKS